VRVVHLWRHSAHSSGEVIDVVLSAPSYVKHVSGGGRVHAQAYLIAPGRAHCVPHSIRELFEWLRPNCETIRRASEPKKTGGRRTEGGVVIPPDIALCAVHQHWRCFPLISFFFATTAAEGIGAIHVYAFEGISVLMKTGRIRPMVGRVGNG